MKSWKDYCNSSVHKYKYKTNLQFIFIQDKNTIDRRTLEIDYGIGIERNLQCKIFEGNLKDYFIKKKKD